MSQISIPTPLIDSAANWVEYISDLRGDYINNQRKQASKRLRDYYDGRQRDELVRELANRYGSGDINKKPKWTNNVLKQAVDMVAITYSSNVNRRIIKEGLSADIKLEIERMLFGDLKNSLQQGNRYLVYDQMLLIKPTISIKKKRITYELYNQFQFDLAYDQNVTGEKILTSVILSDYARRDEETIYHVYTDKKFYKIQNSKVLVELENPINVLPFVLVTASPLGFDDYLDPAAEKADGNLELNIMATNIQIMHKHQAATQAVLTTTSDLLDSISEHADDPNKSVQDNIQPAGARIQLDASKILTLYKTPDGNTEEFSYVAPNSDFEGALAVLQFYTNQYATSFGLPPDTLDINTSVRPAMNVYLNDKKIRGMTSGYNNIFVQAEKELFVISSLMAEMEFGLVRLEEGDVEVEFTPENKALEYLSPAELIELKREGVIDNPEVLKKLSSGLSREEAVQYFNSMHQSDDKNILDNMEEQNE